MNFFSFIFEQLANIGIKKSLILVAMMTSPFIDMSVIVPFEAIEASDITSFKASGVTIAGVNTVNEITLNKHIKNKGLNIYEVFEKVENCAAIVEECNNNYTSGEQNKDLENIKNVEEYSTMILNKRKDSPSTFSKIIEVFFEIFLAPSMIYEVMIVLAFSIFTSLKLPYFQKFKELEEDLALQKNIYYDSTGIPDDISDEKGKKEEGNSDLDSDSDSIEIIDGNLTMRQLGTLIVVDKTSSIVADVEFKQIGYTSNYKYDYENSSGLFSEKMYEKLDEFKLDCMNNHMELCDILTEDVGKSTDQKLNLLFKKISDMMDVKFKENSRVESRLSQVVEDFNKQIEGIMLGMQINLNKITKENQKIRYLLKNLQQNQQQAMQNI